MQIVTTTENLEDICQELQKDYFIAIDTEFMRESSYFAKLCLVQIAGQNGIFLIDTLAENIDLSPLYALMANPNVLKVFHAGRQDMEIFYYAMHGDLPHPVFDTQIAAMVCGYGDQVGYETLVKSLAKAKIDKSSRFTDWSRRPLTQKQLAYAANDVKHLRTIFSKLVKKIEKAGRSEWLKEEMEILASPQSYQSDPQKVWRRMRSRSHNPRYLAIVRALAAWRELEAQRRDVPRNRILRDEQIFEIASHHPKTAEDLSHTRGLSTDYAHSQGGNEILQRVAEAASLPESELPHVVTQEKPSEEVEATVALLKVLLKLKCERYDVAKKLVASNEDLIELASEQTPQTRQMHGWRYEVFGKDAMALKAGTHALSIKGGKMALVDLQPEGSVS